MTAVVLQPPKKDIPAAPMHLEPAGPIPQGYLDSFIRWIYDTIASLGDLLLPTLTQERVTVLPTLAKTATYETFCKFVYGEVQSRIDRVDRKLSTLAATDFEKLDHEMTKVAEIVSLLVQTRDWITTNQTPFKAKRLEAVRISRELQKTDLLVDKLLSRISNSGDLIQPAPPNWSPLTLKSPGLENHGNDCFMNACLQTVFGDPVAYKWIAQNEYQHKRVKLSAFKHRHSCVQGQKTPLNMAQFIRNMYPLIKGFNQEESHLAFLCLIDQMSGKGSDRGSPYFKDHREYLKGNPFVHKLIRESTFDNISLEQVEKEDLTSFQGNVHHSEGFEWCPLIPLEGNQESQAIESIFENFFAPSKGFRQNFNFTFKDKTKQEVESSIEHLTFEKCPNHFFFNLKRNMYKDGKYHRVSTPIEIGETFYLDPKYIKDREGGKFAVTAFTCHSGGISSGSGQTGGHYYAYRRVLNKDTKEPYWIKCDDASSTEVPLQVVLNDLRTRADLVLVERVDFHLTREEIKQGVQDNITRAKAIELREQVNAAKAPLPIGNTIDIKEKHLQRLHLFNSLLNQEDIQPAQLTKVFQNTPPEFQQFIHNLLVLTKKMEEDGDVLEHVHELKMITTPYLTTELQKHIVQQYEYIRRQQLQLAKDKLKFSKEEQYSIITLNNHNETNTILSRLILQIDFREQNLKVLLNHGEGIGKELLMLIGEVLLPGLTQDVSKLEAEKEESTITQILQTLLNNTTEFRQSIESQQKLYTRLGG